MRILFSCGDYYPNLGGATTLVDDLALALLDRGHGVSLLTRMHEGLAQSESFHGYEIRRIDYPLCYEKFNWSLPLFSRSLKVLAQLRPFLRAGSFDTVCIGLLDMSAWYLLLLRPFLGFRLVLYLHGGETRLLPQRNRSYRILLRAALRFSDAVIAVSNELKTEAARHWAGALQKSVVIRNAVDLKMMAETIPVRRSRPYISAVGRLVPEKDFATLLKAFALIQPKVADVDLVIVGEGKLRQELMDIAQKCPFPDRVIFAGRLERQDALAVMKGSMFFVLSSVTEGFPIVLVEALVLGKMVVGSNIPGIAAIIDDGRQGRLFPAGNAAALAALLRLCCVDAGERARLSRGAAQMDLSEYDMRNVLARHLAVIEGGR